MNEIIKNKQKQCKRTSLGQYKTKKNNERNFIKHCSRRDVAFSRIWLAYYVQETNVNLFPGIHKDLTTNRSKMRSSKRV